MGLPWGLGSKAQLLKSSLELDLRLGDPKAPQAPCSCSSFGTLAQTLGLWQKFGVGCTEAEKPFHFGPPGRALYSRGPQCLNTLLLGLVSQGLVPILLPPPLPAQASLEGL